MIAYGMDHRSHGPRQVAVLRFHLDALPRPAHSGGLRTDAHNALRLAEIARNDRVKKMLLSAANEFLNKAAEVEATTMAVVAPLSD